MSTLYISPRPTPHALYPSHVGLRFLLLGDLNCWVDAMALRYNSTNRTSTNAPGLDVRVPSFGVTDSVEYIDPSWAAWIVGNIGMYAAPLVESKWAPISNTNSCAVNHRNLWPNW